MFVFVLKKKKIPVSVCLRPRGNYRDKRWWTKWVTGISFCLWQPKLKINNGDTNTQTKTELLGQQPFICLVQKNALRLLCWDCWIEPLLKNQILKLQSWPGRPRNLMIRDFGATDEYNVCNNNIPVIILMPSNNNPVLSDQKFYL